MMQAVRRSTALAVMALAMAACVTAQAQSSRRPLRIIVPADAGSVMDVIARTVQPALSKALDGQPVIVENIPAAGGVVATTQLVQSSPDGNTVSMVSDNHTVNPHVFAKLPYDTLKDITPISVLVSIPMVLVATPALPVHNAAELGQYLKSKPAGSFNFASSGPGTVIHLAGKMFADAVKADVVHVPYKGVSPQMLAIANGEAQFGVIGLPAVQGFLKAGTLKGIALMGGPRLPGLPDPLPMQGLPEVNWSAWVGVIARAGLPAEETSRLYNGFRTAFAAPDVAAAVQKLQVVVNLTPPEETARFLKSEFDRYGRIVKSAGITPN